MHSNNKGMNKQKNYYLVMMVITGVFFLLLHLSFVGFTNDETFFLVYKEKFDSLFKIIIDRYKTDSSRVLSETLLFFLLDKPFIVWQILDVLICLLTVHSLSVILVNDKESKSNIIIFMAVAAYPFMHVGSAGWICTSLNYLWPLATLLYGISGAFRRGRGENIRGWQYALYILSFIFTANCEMSSTALVLLFVLAVGISTYEKRSKWYEIVGLLIGIAGLVFAFTAPGNGERTVMEAENWMPEFFDLTIVDKFRLCSVFVFEHFVAIPDVLFFLFAFVIAIRGVSKKNSLSNNIVAVMPLLIDVAFTCYYLFPFIVGLTNGTREFKYDFTTPTIFINDSKTAIIQYSELAGLYLFIITAVIAICKIVPTVKERIMCVWALGTGFAVRMALMLSPTMFSSWHRTLIFMYFGFIYAILVMLLPVLKNKDTGKWTKIILYGILVLGIIVNLVLTVGLQMRKAA